MKIVINLRVKKSPELLPKSPLVKSHSNSAIMFLKHDIAGTLFTAKLNTDSTLLHVLNSKLGVSIWRVVIWQCETVNITQTANTPYTPHSYYISDRKRQFSCDSVQLFNDTSTTLEEFDEFKLRTVISTHTEWTKISVVKAALHMSINSRRQFLRVLREYSSYVHNMLQTIKASITICSSDIEPI